MTCPTSLLLLTTTTTTLLFPASLVLALPPPSDPPEEILRTEIITEARSPLDGQPLSPADYAELQVKIQQGQPTPPQVARPVKKTIGLLKLRKFIRKTFPFIPIK
ncbi:MAG: hypothetical protein HC780_06930 [Leptolyngbyaceae cyanobacterium CSU_1_3]|nr:hypothetical protein [Leptolyngbyaceae cyanobacterium CSU_1_3]